MFHLSCSERDYTNKIIKDISCNSKCPSLDLSLMLRFRRSTSKETCAVLKDTQNDTRVRQTIPQKTRDLMIGL